jgi:hypothetical protein
MQLSPILHGSKMEENSEEERESIVRVKQKSTSQWQLDEENSKP